MSDTTDRRKFLAAAAAALVAGPAAAAAAAPCPTCPRCGDGLAEGGEGNWSCPTCYENRADLRAMLENGRRWGESRKHAELAHLIGAMKYARGLADSFFQDHGPGCGCVGCEANDMGPEWCVEYEVLPLLEVAIGRVEGDVCGGVEMDGETFAEDRTHLAELGDRVDELWNAESADAPAAVVAGS